MHDVIHMRQKYSEYYRLGQENDSKTTLALIKKKKKRRYVDTGLSCESAGFTLTCGVHAAAVQKGGQTKF